MENGELPEEAAIREILEETGWQVRIDAPFRSVVTGACPRGSYGSRLGAPSTYY